MDNKWDKRVKIIKKRPLFMDAPCFITFITTLINRGENLSTKGVKTLKILLT